MYSDGRCELAAVVVAALLVGFLACFTIVHFFFVITPRHMWE